MEEKYTYSGRSQEKKLFMGVLLKNLKLTLVEVQNKLGLVKSQYAVFYESI